MIIKIKSHVEFCLLAEEYRKSLKKIVKRKDSKESENEMTLLNSIERDLKECIRELENYYKSSYWRNEKITTNSKKAIKTYFNLISSDDYEDNQ